MSTTKSVSQIFTLVLVLAGLALYNFIGAQVWTPPLSAPPLNNAYEPINVGPLYQLKSGGIGALRMAAGVYYNADASHSIVPGNWVCPGTQVLRGIQPNGVAICVNM
jgi:hypothetical protein